MRNPVKFSLLISISLIAGWLLLAPAAGAAKSGRAPVVPAKAVAAKGAALFQTTCPPRPIPINFGQEITGRLETGDCRLDDNSFYDLYSFFGVGGQQIAISLSSSAFDTYLFLYNANLEEIEADDDGGGGTNSRIPAGMGFLTLPSSGTYFILANSFMAGETGEYTLRLTTTGAVPQAAVNAASFSGLQLAPNSIAAIFGTGLATGTVSATTRPLPTTLGSTRVEVTSGSQTLAAPLFFVSASQVNFLVPAGLPSGSATVRVFNGSTQVAQAFTVIAATGPGLFTANASGQGLPAAVAVRVGANGTQTTEAVTSAPIDLGPATDTVILVLFGTGIRGRSALNQVRVTIGGVDAEVQFAGLTPNFDGLDQINVRIPRSLIGRGEVDVTLSVDERVANTVRINIK